MIWLAIHMWLLLLAAFAVGMGAGLWIRAGGARRPPAPADGDEAALGTLELDGPAVSDPRPERNTR